MRDDSGRAVAPLEAWLLLVVDRGGPVGAAALHDRHSREHLRGIARIAERCDLPPEPVRWAEDARASSVEALRPQPLVVALGRERLDALRHRRAPAVVARAV